MSGVQTTGLHSSQCLKGNSIGVVLSLEAVRESEVQFQCRSSILEDLMMYMWFCTPAILNIFFSRKSGWRETFSFKKRPLVAVVVAVGAIAVVV